METLWTLLFQCEGIRRSLVVSPHRWPMIRSFDFGFALILYKLMNKQSSCRWFETPQHPSDANLMGNFYSLPKLRTSMRTKTQPIHQTYLYWNRNVITFNEIFVPECTEGCHNDNFPSSHWRTFRQNNYISIADFAIWNTIVSGISKPYQVQRIPIIPLVDSRVKFPESITVSLYSKL